MYGIQYGGKYVILVNMVDRPSKVCRCIVRIW